MKKWHFVFLVLVLSHYFGFANSVFASESDYKKFEVSTAFCFVIDTTGLGKTEGGVFDGYYFLTPNLGVGAALGVYNSFYYQSFFKTDSIVSSSPQTILSRFNDPTNYVTRTEILGCFKYRLGNSHFDPYLTAGGGALLASLSGTNNISYQTTPWDPNINQDYPPSTSNFSQTLPTYPVVQLGVGFETMLFPAFNVFIDGKWSLIFSNGISSGYVPLRLGLNLDL